MRRKTRSTSHWRLTRTVHRRLLWWVTRRSWNNCNVGSIIRLSPWQRCGELGSLGKWTELNKQVGIKWPDILYYIPVAFVRIEWHSEERSHSSVMLGPSCLLLLQVFCLTCALKFKDSMKLATLGYLAKTNKEPKQICLKMPIANVLHPIICSEIFCSFVLN